MISAIAEAGTMTKAARKLFITQSALSQQLKDIEGKLGIDLFFRTHRKMILTTTGNKVLKTAERIIETLEDTELEIARTVSGDEGGLKVGTRCIFCYKWLPRVMRLFQDKFPNIDFELGNSDDLVQDLESKRFDLIITAMPLAEDPFASQPLFEDLAVCIMPADHPLNARDFVDFEDFGRFNFIGHEARETNRFYQAVLKPRGIEPKHFMVLSQPGAILEMVASGFGLAVFPRWSIRSSHLAGEISARPITKNGLPLAWRAAFLENSNLPVFQQEFIHIIRKLNIPQSRWPAARAGCL